MEKNANCRWWLVMVCAVSFSMAFPWGNASGGDLPEVRKSGVLRHLGVPYANFATGAGNGMDVELVQQFARFLGVKYVYVQAEWDTVVEDLIGRKVKVKGDDAELMEEVPVRGDLIANGFTLLPWRKKVVDFSSPTFPSQIWLVARANSKVKPVHPSKSLDQDIERVRALLKNKKVLTLKKTCLDPDIYNLSATGAKVVCFTGKLNELAPAIIKGESEMTILDVPDALVALEKWPGKIKVIGPISRRQEMGAAFPKSSPQLRQEFNRFLEQSKKDGTYSRIVKKYYPTAFASFPDFFKDQ